MSALSEGQRLGSYRIVRLLGEGGMGAVYEARQESLDRRVALKTLHAEFAQDQEFIARFFNEAKVLSQLPHPSIVQVSDFGKAADGSAYLAMEYLRGQSLGRRLRELCDRGERLPTLTALQLGFHLPYLWRFAARGNPVSSLRYSVCSAGQNGCIASEAPSQQTAALAGTCELDVQLAA